MNSLRIKKGDTVVVISGRDKGKQGKVIATIPTENKVIVENINVVKRHTRPRKQGEEGGILKKELPIRANKVMRVCPKCDKAARTGYKLLDDGSKVRVCKKCGATV